MKYTISELINKFEINYIGHCTKGSCEGGFIICDTLDNNRLVSIFPEGFISYDFNFRLSDITVEEGREWIFIHEQDKDEKNLLKHKLANALVECVKNGYEFRID